MSSYKEKKILEKNQADTQASIFNTTSDFEGGKI
jgi:hypothetical protein